MKRMSINPENDWGHHFHLDQGEVIEDYKRLLHLSGQVSIETDPSAELGVTVHSPNDQPAQVKHALNKIDVLLEKAGMSRKNIIFIKFYTLDVGNFLEHYHIYGEWISEVGINPPNTLLGINALALPGIMIEIEVTAAE